MALSLKRAAEGASHGRGRRDSKLYEVRRPPAHPIRRFTVRTVTPPYGIVHVSAPDAEAFVLESRPLLARIVFGPCRLTAPFERSSQPWPLSSAQDL